MRLLLLSVMVLITLGCHSNPAPPAVDAPTGVVTMQIKSGAAIEQEFELMAVADGSTLESVMRRVDQVDVELSGNGLTAFVHAIDGVRTDASQGWTFKIDGQFANQGIGQTVLHPPTTVEWSYGTFEM